MRPLVILATGLAAAVAGAVLSLVPTPVVASQPVVRTPLPTLHPLPVLDVATTSPAPSAAVTGARPDGLCDAAHTGAVATAGQVTYICRTVAGATRWHVVAA